MTGRSGRRRRPRTAATAAAALACLLLPACAAADADGSRAEDGAVDAAGPAAERSGLVAGLVLPLEHYMVTHPERAVAEGGYRDAVEECMARFGFELPPVDEGPPPPSLNPANMERRYGVSDPETVARHGYRLPGTEVERPPSDGLPGGEAAARVLDGDPRGDAGEHEGSRIPDGGCAGEAERRVGRVDDMLAAQLSMESLHRSEEDPRVQAAHRDWSACMAERGYAVAHPHEASGLLPWETERATEEEITLALADVGCKESTDLVARWFRVEEELQRRLIEENVTALEEAREHNTELIVEFGAE